VGCRAGMDVTSIRGTERRWHRDRVGGGHERARIRLDPTPRILNGLRSLRAGLDLDAASTLHAVVMCIETQITTEQVR
jgi:hypothetical protein